MPWLQFDNMLVNHNETKNSKVHEYNSSHTKCPRHILRAISLLVLYYTKVLNNIAQECNVIAMEDQKTYW